MFNSTPGISGPIVLVLLFGLTAVSCTREPPDRSVAEPVRKVENPININTASEEQLRRLPYIGEKLAAEIVEFRTLNGGFHRPEQLLLLKGISEKRFREIRPFIVTE